MHRTVIHSLVNPLYSLKRLCMGGEGVDFLHLTIRRQAQRGGDGSRLREGGEEESAEGDNRGI